LEVWAHEIKSGATFRPDHVKNLLAWSDLSGVPTDHLRLHNDGDETFTHRGVLVSPWGE
jgi:hypothetical protein